MNASDVDDARAIARELTAASSALVLGTFGLVIHGVLAADHAADVDLLASVDDVPALVHMLFAHGFAVKSWEDPIEITKVPDVAALAGHFYVRGTRGGLVVDVTYEGIDLATWASDAVVVDGIRVASIERIVALKRTRDLAKDRRVLALVSLPK